MILAPSAVVGSGLLWCMAGPAHGALPETPPEAPRGAEQVAGTVVDMRQIHASSKRISKIVRASNRGPSDRYSGLE